MNSKLSFFLHALKEELSLYIGICLGVFLFVLFFQPFPLQRFDLNNSLVFAAGLSGIMFFSLILGRIAMKTHIQNFDQHNPEAFFPPYFRSFIILSISAVGFAFYLRYVGRIPISFYIMFKVVLICLAPTLIMRYYDIIRGLKKQNESLLHDKEQIQLQVDQLEEDYQNKTIELVSENRHEKLVLPVAEVALIKSAENYVEIVFMEGSNFQKKLIRNTLKNIEHQLKPYSNFIRCHRICIINTHFIEKLNKNFSRQWLTIRDYHESIPVSRQYVLKIKEAL